MWAEPTRGNGRRALVLIHSIRLVPQSQVKSFFSSSSSFFLLHHEQIHRFNDCPFGCFLCSFNCNSTSVQNSTDVRRRSIREAQQRRTHQRTHRNGFGQAFGCRKTFKRRAHQWSSEHEPQQIVWSWTSMRCYFFGSHNDYRLVLIAALICSDIHSALLIVFSFLSFLSFL